MKTELQVNDLTAEPWFSTHLVPGGDRWLQAVEAVISPDAHLYEKVTWDEVSMILCLSAMTAPGENVMAHRIRLDRFGWPVHEEFGELPDRVAQLLKYRGMMVLQLHIDFSNKGAEFKQLAENQDKRVYTFELPEEGLAQETSTTFTRIPQPVLKCLADLCEFGFNHSKQQKA